MTSCAPSDPMMTSLRVRVPGAPDDLIILELWNIIDEFLRRTNAWRYETEVQLSDGEGEYPLALPSDSALVRVMGVSYNGMPVAQANSGTVQSSTGTLVPELTFPDGDALFAPQAIDLNPSTQIFSWAIYRPEYVTITNPPTDGAQYPFKLLAALSISHRCMTCACGDWDIPEWMWQTYFQPWLDGTLARLHAMPAKPWRDVVMAQYHGRRFRSAMGQAKQEAQRGFQYNNAPWRFPRSGW